VTSAGSAPPKLEIRTLQQAGVRVVAIAGDVVVETAAQLEAELAAAARSGDVVLDLSEVPFMDSTGLRVILSARDDAVAARGRLVLVVAPDGQVEGLLDFMEVKRRLPTAGSRERALADLGSRG
jgi:stage II sporulation protein AA (anti-sigma F factor antagonist)